MKITDEHKLYIEFAIGCAYRVLPIFEKKYPEDKRPRNALIAAWNFLIRPTKANKKAAAAAYAASAAASDAYADAAYADAAYAASAAAAYAASAASAAAAAASDAYADAAYADAAYAAYASADERKWQAGFLFALNAKYRLSVKIRGVE